MGQGFACGNVSDTQEFGLASTSELTDPTSQSLVSGQPCGALSLGDLGSGQGSEG